MELIHPLTQEYAEQYSSKEDELLAEINQFTRDRHHSYNMLSGHLQGKLLEMVSRMIRPSRILEIGTFTGYSAICLAKGLTPGGKLHTIELRDADADVAQGYFDRSGLDEKIILHRGNALEVVPLIEEVWDLVFIDADKVAYIDYFKLVLPRLKQNGFILADNIFFHGEVLNREVTGKNGKAIQAFNEYIRANTEIDKMIITLRDGLYLMRKL